MIDAPFVRAKIETSKRLFIHLIRQQAKPVASDDYGYEQVTERGPRGLTSGNAYNRHSVRSCKLGKTPSAGHRDHAAAALLRIRICRKRLLGVSGVTHD